MVSEFTLETALALLEKEHEVEFPINFDDAWQWVGYSNKQNGKRMLVSNFQENVEYMQASTDISPTPGRFQGLEVHLTSDCFKAFCMLAQTEKGREVRRYFIQAEKMTRSLLQEKLEAAERAQAEAIAQQTQATKFLTGWREIRKSTKFVQVNFQNACLAKKHPAPNVHDYITWLVRGKTAKQARATAEFVEGDATVGLNYVPDEKELTIIGRAKELYCKYRRGTWKEQCYRAVENAMDETL